MIKDDAMATLKIRRLFFLDERHFPGDINFVLGTPDTIRNVCPKYLGCDRDLSCHDCIKKNIEKTMQEVVNI